MNAAVTALRTAILVGAGGCIPQRVVAPRHEWPSTEKPDERPSTEKPRVSVRYDKFRDNTVLKLEAMHLLEVPGAAMRRRNPASDELRVGALAAYPGRMPQRPAYVGLWFVSISANWRYLRGHNLVLLVDGERVDLGTMEHDGSVGRGYVLEQMFTDVPVDVFLRVAGASRVEGRLFTTEFVLPPNVRAGLRLFASRIQEDTSAVPEASTTDAATGDAPTAAPPARLTEGETCSLDTDCSAGLLCVGAGSAKTCQLRRWARTGSPTRW